jgi:hypothetical protein
VTAPASPAGPPSPPSPPRPAGAADRSAARLLRWYPASWRARYGEEFTELLLAEFAERPLHWRRTANVILSGLLARASGLGLTGFGLSAADQARASLATLGCAVAAFGTFGLAMLAQLAIGWQWARPHGAATTSGLAVMIAAAAVLGLVALLAAVPVAWCAGTALLGRGERRRLAGPALFVLAGGAALVAGAHHFQNAWPGTGGTAAHRGLVPAGAAAFSWASTLSVSSYWAHPAALRAFPAAELGWMALSPLALLSLVGGAAVLVRRLRPPARLLAYEVRLAAAAALAMSCFLAGAAWWVFGPGSGPAGLFHAGVVDVAGLAVMTVALLAAVRAAVTARRGVLGLAAGR